MEVYGLSRNKGTMRIVEAEPEVVERDRTATPVPHGSGRLDRMVYRPVHFYGAKLCSPLAAAAQYLQHLEQLTGRSPHVLCVYDAFSSEDEGSDLAWQVTLVLSEPTPLPGDEVAGGVMPYPY
jgi:hypothetical protein